MQGCQTHPKCSQNILQQAKHTLNTRYKTSDTQHKHLLHNANRHIRKSIVKRDYKPHQVCPSPHKQQHDSHQTDFCDISHTRIPPKMRQHILLLVGIKQK